jgi:hypothetical protein
MGFALPTCVLVRTEAVVAAAASRAFDLANSESPEFIGKVIAGLFKDSKAASRFSVYWTILNCLQGTGILGP